MNPKDKSLEMKNYLKNGYGKFNDIQSELISLIICEEVIHQLKICKSSTNDCQSINERIDFFKCVKKQIE